MKSLTRVDNFGGTDADNDDILLQAFEDHEAYLDVLAFSSPHDHRQEGQRQNGYLQKIITTKRLISSHTDTPFRTIRGIITSDRLASAFLISTNTHTAGST